MHDQSKAAVSVSEMAHLVGLSRARFYQMIGTTFPYPVYNVRTRRPVYVEELQRICLEIRRSGLGFDGQPVVFNTKRRHQSERTKPSRRSMGPVSGAGRHEDLLNSLRALGLSMVKEDHVDAALKTLYPNGFDGEDQGQVIRALFLHLRQQPGLG
jgi:hypothetical protein